MSKRWSITSVLAALFALCLLIVAPASFAAPTKARSDKAAAASSKAKAKGHSATAGDKDGDADSDAGTSYTEDNDGNDGGTPNNVSDDGDNAHPSGKDRSVEHGGSGNQGKSESNPDDSKGPMRYEGELGDDKPNGPGGTDLADQDGNNGCGNDDDFDDDNNGWCGKPKANEPEVDDETAEPEKPCDANPEMSGVQPCNVKGPEVEVRPARPARPQAKVLGEVLQAQPQTEVLGSVMTQEAPAEPSGAALPFTGAAILGYATAALALIGTGTVLIKK